MRLLSLLLLCAIALAAPAEESIQPLDSIRDAVRLQMQQQYSESENGAKITIGRLDRRLRLAKCSAPLTATVATGKARGGRQTVEVSCDGDKPWSLYVPATVSIKKRILIASHDLARGSIISKADVRFELRDSTKLHRGFISRPEYVLGKRLKREIREDQVLTARQLTMPKSIKRGSKVTILAKIGKIEVRMSGKALGDGGVGERIRVINQRSKRLIEATVVSTGVVRVSL